MLRFLTLCVLCAVFGAWTLAAYVSRLPDYRGFHKPSVITPDHPATDPRSRRVVLIVVDGLRRDMAEKMAIVMRLKEEGVCIPSTVGSLTVSRPVYATIATGLESDRSGVRNNDLEDPLPVESVFDVAREAGLTVEGRSELAWWRQLFPNGFDRYEIFPAELNMFERPPSADLTLVHPVDTDETAHDYGVFSPAHQKALAKVDAQMLPFIAQLDFTRDTVIFTADHGHRDAGGHGAQQPEVATVLTCLAGAHINRAAKGMTHLQLAPLMSALLGIRFPANMASTRIEGLVTLPAAPLLEAERAFDEPDIATIYEQARRAQHLRAAACALLLGVALGWARRGQWRSYLWMFGFCALVYISHRLLMGEFDFSAIARRNPFLTRGLLISFASAIALALTPGRRELPWLMASGVWVLAGHIVVYGWPIGFPIPEPVPFYVPFFVPMVLVALSVVTAGVRVLP